jgi:hypothetical protein
MLGRDVSEYAGGVARMSGRRSNTLSRGLIRHARESVVERRRRLDGDCQENGGSGSGLTER